MSAREDWQAHCGSGAWYDPHGHQLALAAIAELDAEVAELRTRERRVPGDAERVNLYPPGWGTDRLTGSCLAEKLTNAAEAARGSGQVAILEDGETGTEVAAIVPLAWLDRGDGLPVIPDKELKVEVVRAPHPDMGGLRAGVDTMVRLTHLPTGITAECDTERSQLQNKQIAMRQLRETLAARQRGEAPPIGLAPGDKGLFGPYVSREEAMRLAIEADERSGRALKALEDGVYDGAHHKDWVIDQAVRRLLGCPEVSAEGTDPRGSTYYYTKLGTNEAYAAWLDDHEGWSEGVAP